jgi:hypothetical protein
MPNHRIAKTRKPAPVPRPILRHWDQLRIDYVQATPRQRLGPIVSRLMDPLHWGPNLLITGISSVEAFARCLVVEALAKSRKQPKVAVYEDVKDASAVELVLQYLTLREAGPAVKVFGAVRWRSFAQAVNKYRHVVLHECTYLNGSKLQELNSACQEVLVVLVELSEHKERFDHLVAETHRTYRDAKAAL